MDVALELEDDVFFADLSRRIALLIMDDDAGEAALWPQRPSISSRAFSHTSSQPAVPSVLFYEQVYRREVRGTGVFIPQLSTPRRKQRAGKPRHNGSKPKALVSAATMGPTTKSSKNGSGRQQQHAAADRDHVGELRRCA